MRRLLNFMAALGFLALVVALGVLAADPLETNWREPVSCGSLLDRVEPDPTAQEESGCSELFADRGAVVMLVAVVGGGLVAAVAVAAFAQAAVARWGPRASR